MGGKELGFATCPGTWGRLGGVSVLQHQLSSHGGCSGQDEAEDAECLDL